MKNPKQKYFLLVLDWLILLFAYSLSIKLHNRLDIDLFYKDFPFLASEIWFYLFYSIVIIFIFYINRLYNIDIYLSATRQFQSILHAMVFTVIGLALISFFTKSSIIVDSRAVILYYFLISVFLLVTFRIFLLRSFLKNNFLSIIPPRKVIIIGTEGIAKELVNQINKYYPFRIKVMGFLDDNLPIGDIVLGRTKVIGKISEYDRLLDLLEIDEVIFCLESISEEKYIELIEGFSKTRARVLIAADKFRIISTLLPEEHYGSIPIVGVLNNTSYMGLKNLKRIVDIVLSSIFLIILSPLFLIIGILIKIDSRGPILYKQTRIGKNGKSFTFYKFRSMYKGSDQDAARVERLKKFIKQGEIENNTSTKIVDESKITRIGRFIRKTSIDELPQLLNVLKGDMSLVGPRPCLPYEWEHYDEWHKKRLSVTPGCTGIWQVFGRSVVGFREMAILDLYYIYNRSFHLDIWLIFKTIPVMLFGTGGK